MKIYEPTETQFKNNGLGVIKPLKCVEHKDRSLDGWYIEVTAPIEYKDVIKQDYIAFVDTKEKGGQPFRINNISFKNRIIAFTANHIVFDAERYLLDDVRPTNQTALSFLSYINNRTDTPSPFIVSSDIANSGTSYFIRKTLFDGLLTTEKVFGGTYDVDRYNITLKNHVGNDNGVCVTYGKNIEDMSVTEDWGNVCTKILPEGTNGILLPEKYLIADVQYAQPFTRTIKFDTKTENDDGTKISESDQIIELRELAKAYLNENKCPKISYIAKASPDDELCIGDTIHIKHPLCTIDAEVFSYIYDTIAKKVTEIVFGNYKPTARRAVASIKNEIEIANKRITDQESMIQHQTDLINSQYKNGNIYLDKNELLILDKLPKELAKYVWRFNMGGLGHSKNGYLGPFDIAITQDGKINANFILAGIIRGIELIGNTITNGNNFSVDAEGNLKAKNADLQGEIVATGGSIGGWTVKNGELIKTFTYNVPNYTDDDLEKIKQIILNGTDPTEYELNRYDLDFNGYISSVDYITVKNVILGLHTHTWTITVRFAPMDTRRAFSFTIDEGNGKVRTSYMSIAGSSIYNMRSINKKVTDLTLRLGIVESKLGI